MSGGRSGLGTGLTFMLVGLVLATVIGTESRAATWSLRAPGGAGDGVPAVAAEAYSRSGEARLAVGCTGQGLLFSSLEYVGYETVASTLRVVYRVDGRNEIAARWPVEPRDGTLLLYQSNDVYLQEFARRLMRGNWMRLEVEVLPPLTFSLDGSRDVIAAVLNRCGRPGEEGREEESGGEEGSTPRDGNGGGTGPSEPTPLTR